MFELFVNFITAYVLGAYIITVLQWYNYKASRIIFHFHNYKWHLFYFVVPVVTYIAAYKFFWIYLFFGLIPALFLWFRRTKGLVITGRVKRFFTILGFLETINLVFLNKLHYNPGISVLAVVVLAVALSEIIEGLMFFKYKKEAKAKLQKISPKIITITASYGKTSIKNFIHQLLSEKFKTHKTPRSVNTIKGIVLDINQNLPEDTQIYVTEAGARERGDIKEIVTFLENEYSVLGKVGLQHIEYFKTLENIIATKLEVFDSPKLLKGFSYETEHEKAVILKDKIKDVNSSLNGTKWKLEINGEDVEFESRVLGSFNAINISLAVYQTLEFIDDIEYIKQKVLNLEPIPHRLQKIEAGGKIIIDDSFNGNIEGMLESFEIVKAHPGRKVIVTPGLVEATKEMNEKIAKAINETFDLAIITGGVNKRVLCSNITIDKVYVSQKEKLEKILQDLTRVGDLILFSNDTPNYL
ncbi:MAG: UDP-N-acetylmuramoyl-tripeptide--D-alanyl-D-alanine ligase [Epsilonproteobacteria bacterium]|nr:UDP-N-acetylmuramoyl-tripeptide--D-alanyl-D-alanine ligase [Campylobacterota bacterium]